MASRSSPAEPRRRSRLGAIAGAALAVLLLVALAGCGSAPLRAPMPPGPAGPAVAGDEIIAAGVRIHTGTRVVTWREPGGYDGYTGMPPQSPRRAPLCAAELKRVQARGWTLPDLQRTIDQFVLHYDAAGLSKACYQVLNQRHLNVHFLLDLDGTIYQTVDLQERAWHATSANDRSIGIEIANIGAYAPGATKPLDEWYRRRADGGTDLTIPERFRVTGLRTPDFQRRPARAAPVRGTIQHQTLVQYDFTPGQYAALIKLTAALCRTFPRLAVDYPHTGDGRVIPHQLAAKDYARFRGILGHYHIQNDKIDPGPAFQWEAFIGAVKHTLH